jgi:hypothetical protein
MAAVESVLMSDWLVWGVLLVLQNASHTASSRAKNSRSLWYSATTGVFSNGVWFASQFFIVGHLVKAQGHPGRLAMVAFFYVTLTVAGSVCAHWYLLRFEKRRGIE